MGNIQGKPITDLIGEIGNGRLLRELTEETYNIVAAVMETRKAGGLTLKISFAPTGKGTVEIDAKFDVKLPERDRPSTTFFVNRVFSLVRNDPSQPSLPLRAVETPDDRPVRTADGAALRAPLPEDANP